MAQGELVPRSPIAGDPTATPISVIDQRLRVVGVPRLDLELWAVCRYEPNDNASMTEALYSIGILAAHEWQDDRQHSPCTPVGPMRIACLLIYDTRREHIEGSDKVTTALLRVDVDSITCSLHGTALGVEVLHSSQFRHVTKVAFVIYVELHQYGPRPKKERAGESCPVHSHHHV